MTVIRLEVVRVSYLEWQHHVCVGGAGDLRRPPPLHPPPGCRKVGDPLNLWRLFSLVSCTRTRPVHQLSFSPRLVLLPSFSFQRVESLSSYVRRVTGFPLPPSVTSLPPPVSHILPPSRPGSCYLQHLPFVIRLKQRSNGLLNGFGFAITCSTLEADPYLYTALNSITYIGMKQRTDQFVSYCSMNFFYISCFIDIQGCGGRGVTSAPHSGETCKFGSHERRRKSQTYMRKIFPFSFFDLLMSVAFYYLNLSFLAMLVV